MLSESFHLELEGKSFDTEKEPIGTRNNVSSYRSDINDALAVQISRAIKGKVENAAVVAAIKGIFLKSFVIIIPISTLSHLPLLILRSG